MTSGVHRHFEAVVDAMPERVAAYDGDREITYEEFDAIANGVAAALLDRVAPLHERIVISGGHDAMTAAAMMGVLKAGGAFVVVEASDPPSRRRQIARRADPVAVVTAGSGDHQLGLDVPTIDLDAASTSADRPDIDVEFDDPAWIVFTSGTSGRPKGVLATHGFATRPGIDDATTPPPGAMSLAAGRLCWHGGVSTLVKAWMAGGSLVFHDLHVDSTVELADRIDRFSIDRVFLVPTVARSMFNALGRGRRLESLRHISFGGEPLYWTDIDRCVPHLDPECSLRNTLASSEARAITRFVFAAGEASGGLDGPVPLGPVLDRWKYRIVGTDNQPVPTGEAGEIVVSSPYLFDGYWRDPELDAARLRTDSAGNRWFSTGDMVVEDAGGSLVHAGRTDLQLKVAGVLVAPQEAERALADVAGVIESAVVGVPDAGGRARLVAHVSVGEPFPTRAGLAAVLRDRLPAALVPSEMQLSDSPLPRLGTGKIDRALLAATARSTKPGRGGEPRSEAEKLVAATFIDVLGVDDPGRDDDFWELGGDSLAAVEAVESIELSFGERLPLTALAECPTPALLAARLEGPRRDVDDLVWLTPGEGTPLVIVPGVADTSLRFRRLAGELGPEQPVVVAEHAGSLRRQTPSRSVQAAAARLEELLLPYSSSSMVLLGHSFGGTVVYECARRLAASGRRPALVVLLDLRADGKRSSKAAAHLYAWGEGSKLRWLGEGAAGMGRRALRAMKVPPAHLLAGIDKPGTLRHHDRLAVVANRAGARYRPGAYDGPVLLVRSTDRGDETDPTMGWRAVAPQTRVAEVPGRHDRLPMRSEVAEVLRSALSELSPSDQATVTGMVRGPRT